MLRIPVSFNRKSVLVSGALFAVILANPAMIDAHKAGIPGNGKHFRDGSQMAKIHWNAKKSTEARAPTLVPNTLHDVDFIERARRESKQVTNSQQLGDLK